MGHSLQFPGFRTILLIAFACFLSVSASQVSAQTPAPATPAQDAPAKTDTTKPAPAQAQTEEVSSHDTPATFKVRVNLVLVRVVVRDSHGKIVSNLKKEDFQLFDNKKLQTISSFNVETPEARTASALAATTAEASSSSADAAGGKAVVLPQRFVSMMFDDVHLSMSDAVFVRDSAKRFFESLAASDRVSLNTTSGQLTQEFTDDHDKLANALLGILPRSMSSQIHQCPDVSYYEADLIFNKNDPQALAVATEDALQCAFGGDPRMTAAAQSLAQSTASTALSSGDNETEYAYRHMEEVIRRLASMPGQRVLVLVSPGFITTTLQSEASEIVDRATRSNIVINTIDARGLYTPDVMGDIADPPPAQSNRTAGYKSSYRVAAQFAQEDVLAQLADGTGGKFYHNRNDVDEAMREAGAAPAYSYLLGFSPQNLKIDGRFHALKVALNSKEKFDIQARHGYFAPKTVMDPAESAKLEIQEALFSQEEIRDLPVEFQTQFFKKDEAEAHLAVLTHFDLKGIHFQKVLGRNNDELTIVTGLFDENGNFVTGLSKIVDMKLLDTTYTKLSRSGFTVKSSFDVKPGTYLVRLVVRDAMGAQMAARNGAVVIPY
ncbi:MAG TPA: VWA domain-containing protein [Candidatus Acidoferrum sp.]|nr:VWA domain-containing protein [Candidatus Acidoferrum sp.]